MNKKIFILSLGRKGGCVIYGREIIDHFQSEYDLYISSFCKEKYPKKFRTIKTYKNKKEFIFSSLTILPMLLLRAFCGLITRQYKAFYTPYFHFWNIFVILLFKLFKKPVIITVHDGILHTGDRKLFEQTLNIWCIKLANKIIFLSKYVETLTQQKIGFSAKSYVVPHGIIKPSGLVCKKRKFPSGRLKLLFLGRIRKYKGIELLIEAFKTLPSNVDCTLTIAGEGSYNIEYNYNNNITFINKYLSDEEIVKLLMSNDILILPYIEATQSGIVTLGIASAIPIICTDVGGLKEQLGVENALFVAPTVHSIRDAILKLNSDRELYESLSARLVELDKSLQWDVLSEKIEKIIKGE